MGIMPSGRTCEGLVVGAADRLIGGTTRSGFIGSVSKGGWLCEVGGERYDMFGTGQSRTYRTRRAQPRDMYLCNSSPRLSVL